MVYYIQHIFTDHLKLILPHIQKIEYFSDGCAGQCKNRKNLYNLCQHKFDFGITAVWNFFATSHGKSPCDGIRGTVKELLPELAYRDRKNITYYPLYRCLNFVPQLVVFHPSNSFSSTKIRSLNREKRSKQSEFNRQSIIKFAEFSNNANSKCSRYWL